MSTQPAKTTSAARTRAYRSRLRAQGLRPRTIWAPDVNDPAVRERLLQQSRSLQNDAAEAEIMTWIEEIQAEDDPWG